MTSGRRATLTGILTIFCLGCGGNDSGTVPADMASTYTSSTQYLATVRGKFAMTDLTQAKTTYNQVAMGGMAASQAAGNFSHTVFLGTNLLDSIPNEFISFDRWTDATQMQAFYANPMLAQGFATLFAGAPTIQFYAYEPTWVNWGNWRAADSTNAHFVHLALGVQKGATLALSQMGHDQVAAGGMQPSIQAGNVAHLPYVGLTDQAQFNGIDIWNSSANIQLFYTNPQFVMAFGSLFTTVSQPVYQSLPADWVQW